jgi:hypothetical protein
MKKLILLIVVTIICFSCDETLEKKNGNYQVPQGLYHQILTDTIPTHTLILSDNAETLYIIKDQKIEYVHDTPKAGILLLLILAFGVGFYLAYIIFSD